MKLWQHHSRFVLNRIIELVCCLMSMLTTVCVTNHSIRVSKHFSVYRDLRDINGFRHSVANPEPFNVIITSAALAAEIIESRSSR